MTAALPHIENRQSHAVAGDALRSWLNQVQRHGIKVGLAQIERALELAGHPESAFPSALVVVRYKAKGTSVARAALCTAIEAPQATSSTRVGTSPLERDGSKLQATAKTSQLAQAQPAEHHVAATTTACFKRARHDP